MGVLALIIALGIIVSYGYWSGRHRPKSQGEQKTKVAKVYPLSKSKSQTKLRRIK